jgi:flagellar hook-associated protein 2
MFQLGGLSSGLDTGTMIDQLMLFERKPIVALEQRKALISKKDSAFQSINTRLSALKAKLSDLTFEKNLKAKKVTTSADTILTATAGAGAAEGSYRIKVNQLATSTSLGSSAGLGNAATGALKLSEVKPANTTAITTGTFTIGGSTLTINSTDATLDEVVAAINGLGSANVSVAGTGTGLGGAAASLTPEGQIKLNVALKPTVAIGSGSDTSNFLTVAGLKSPTSSGDSRIGSRMNVAQASQTLTNANLGTAIAGDGSFKINGTEISYTAGTDTLNDVLSRINSSSAGVVASYNSIEDKIVLTNKTTGNAAIGLEEVSGNFLTATKLLGASQTTGQNASITVAGISGNLESSTNEFKNVIPGMVFTAIKADAAETTITVSADSATTVKTVKSFITEYNATIDALEAARGKGQPLQGDSALGSIMNKLQRMIYEPIVGLTDSPNTLSAIGIGTTKDDRKHLSLDETKFKAALEANPDRVAEIFNKDASSSSPTGVAGRLRSYLNEVGGAEGVFAARKDNVARQTKYLDDQIESYENRIEQRRRILVGQFTAMEKAVGLMKSQQTAMLSQLSSLQSS